MQAKGRSSQMRLIKSVVLSSDSWIPKGKEGKIFKIESTSLNFRQFILYLFNLCLNKIGEIEMSQPCLEDLFMCYLLYLRAFSSWNIIRLWLGTTKENSGKAHPFKGHRKSPLLTKPSVCSGHAPLYFGKITVILL